MKHLLAFALVACASLLNAANFTNGQAARVVIGQTQASAESTTANQQTLGGVSGLAWANNTLYAADSNLIGATPAINNRVLWFDTGQIQGLHADLSSVTNPAGDTNCGLCGYNASGVIGQLDFNSTSFGLAATPSTASSGNVGSLWTPTAIATDGTVLAIADSNNNRVLIWRSNTQPSPTTPPDVVLGQKDFTTRQPASTVDATTLRAPQGLWIYNHRLFVADTENNRVLIWNSIPSNNDQGADIVLGQPNFTSRNGPPPTKTGATTAANQLLTPVSVSVSPDGSHFFVADTGFNRILIWNSIPSQNDQPADVEIGQVDMTTSIADNTSAMCASNGTDSSGNKTYPLMCEVTLDHPRAVISDGTRLFVADSGNDRVLIYNQIPTSNAVAADIVLGEPDFVSDLISSQTQTITSTTIDNTGSVDTLPTPTGLAFDGASLYVSDAFNRRIMVFTPGDIVVGQKGVVNTASKITRQEGFVTLSGTVVAKDTVTLTIAGKAYTYTIADKDTLDTITTALINLINANGGDPNVQALATASIPDTVFLDSRGINNSFDQISLSATTSNTANVTATASGGYLTGGTSGTAAPGTLIEVDGQQLADFPRGYTANSQQPLPTILSDPANPQYGSVQVYMDGIPVPVMSASSTQVVAQVPFTFTDRNSTSVYVRTVHSDGQVTATSASTLVLAPANPGLFGVPNATEPRPVFGALHQGGNPSATVSIDGTAQAGDVITITVNGRNYTYTVQSLDTLISIVAGLVANITNANDPDVTAQAGGAFTRVVLVARRAGAAGSGVSVAASVNAASGKSSAGETATAYTSATCCSSSGSGLVTVGNPAQPNEVITFLATGLGLVQDPSGNAITVTTGQPYSGPQPNSATNSVNATVNGVTGQIISAGLAPNGIGLYNVQVLMPSTLPSSGLAQVYIAQNAFISNTVTIPVGSPGSSTINVAIDLPAPQTTLNGGIISAAGWAIDTSSTVSNVSVYVDGNAYGTAQSAARPDVCTAYPSSIDCQNGNLNVGWTMSINTNVLTRGSHTLTVVATAADNNTNSVSTTFSLNNPVMLSVDLPSQGGTVSGTTPLAGWAISTGGTVGNGGSIMLFIDGSPLPAPTIVARPDVCNAFPNAADCAINNNVGWYTTFDTTTLANGKHTLTVTASDSDNEHGAFSWPFTVANADPGTTINVDSPGWPTSTLSGSVTLQGWAVNNSSPIKSVALSIDGGRQIPTTLVARPDVCAAFPAAVGCPNFGWSSPFDSTSLGNGQHTLTVTAVTVSGLIASTSVNFTVANWSSTNPIHLALDLPLANATVSGTTTVAGWTVSDVAGITNVSIAVDGVSFGNASYGSVRQDACNYLPGRIGCPNVGYTAQLDTTLLTDGSHTLTVIAKASNGQTSNTATTFTIANASSSPIHISVDSDLSKPLSGTIPIFGWAGSSNGAVTSVTILIDGVSRGRTTETIVRPDVCTAIPNLVGCPSPATLGWNLPVDMSTLAAGSHSLEVRATTTNGQLTLARSFTVAANSGSVRTFIERPGGAASTLVGTANILGWAVDGNGNAAAVNIYIDAVPQVGLQMTFTDRPDVCAAFNLSGACHNVGWSALIDTTPLLDGNHTLTVVATAGGQSTPYSVPFTVANWTNVTPVQLEIDPATKEGALLASTPVVGTQTFTGWALSDSFDVGQISVSIDGGAPSMATYGILRPDACKNSGTTGCPYVGWSYSLNSTLLPDGVHTLTVTAGPPVTFVLGSVGQNTSVSTTFTISNFGQ